MKAADIGKARRLHGRGVLFKRRGYFMPCTVLDLNGGTATVQHTDQDFTIQIPVWQITMVVPPIFWKATKGFGFRGTDQTTGDGAYTIEPFRDFWRLRRGTDDLGNARTPGELMRLAAVTSALITVTRKKI